MKPWIESTWEIIQQVYVVKHVMPCTNQTAERLLESEGLLIILAHRPTERVQFKSCFGDKDVDSKQIIKQLGELLILRWENHYSFL